MTVPTLASDGNWRVSFVPANGIASKAAPTVAELDAGTELAKDWITPDGINIPPATAERPTSTVGSTFDTARVARRSFSGMSLTCYRAQPPQADTAYDLLTYGTDGFLVVRRTHPNETAYAAGQTVEVYPIECGEPALSPPAANTTQMFTTTLTLTDEPETRALVA